MEGESEESASTGDVLGLSCSGDLGYSSWGSASYSVARYYSTETSEWTGTSSGEMGDGEEGNLCNFSLTPEEDIIL